MKNSSMKLNKKILWILWAFLVSVSTFSQLIVENAKFDKELKKLLSHSVKEILPKDIDSKDAILFLDSRELQEYQTSHIMNALYVGYNDFDLKRMDSVPKGKKIVVYCSVGYRSEKIAEKLKKAGFKDVSNLYGGIFEWVNNEKPVYNANGKTDSVHAFDKTWSKWLLKGKKIY